MCADILLLSAIRLRSHAFARAKGPQPNSLSDPTATPCISLKTEKETPLVRAFFLLAAFLAAGRRIALASKVMKVRAFQP
jgi:hypothetical protein